MVVMVHDEAQDAVERIRILSAQKETQSSGRFGRAGDDVSMSPGVEGSGSTVHHYIDNAGKTPVSGSSIVRLVDRFYDQATEDDTFVTALSNPETGRTEKSTWKEGNAGESVSLCVDKGVIESSKNEENVRDTSCVLEMGGRVAGSGPRGQRHSTPVREAKVEDLIRQHAIRRFQEEMAGNYEQSPGRKSVQSTPGSAGRKKKKKKRKKKKRFGFLGQLFSSSQSLDQLQKDGAEDQEWVVTRENAAGKRPPALVLHQELVSPRRAYEDKDGCVSPLMVMSPGPSCGGLLDEAFASAMRDAEAVPPEESQSCQRNLDVLSEKSPRMKDSTEASCHSISKHDEDVLRFSPREQDKPNTPSHPTQGNSTAHQIASEVDYKVTETSASQQIPPVPSISIKEHDEILLQYEEKHRRELQGIHTQHQALVLDLEKKHAAALQELQSKHREQMLDLEKKHAKKVQDTNAQQQLRIIELERQIALAQEVAENRSKEAMKGQFKEIEETKKDLEKQIEDVVKQKSMIEDTSMTLAHQVAALQLRVKTAEKLAQESRQELQLQQAQVKSRMSAVENLNQEIQTLTRENLRLVRDRSNAEEHMRRLTAILHTVMASDSPYNLSQYLLDAPITSHDLEIPATMAEPNPDVKNVASVAKPPLLAGNTKPSYMEDKENSHDNNNRLPLDKNKMTPEEIQEYNNERKVELDSRLLNLNVEKEQLEQEMSRMPVNSGGKTVAERRRKKQVEYRLDELIREIGQAKRDLRKMKLNKASLF